MDEHDERLLTEDHFFPSLPDEDGGELRDCAGCGAPVNAGLLAGGRLCPACRLRIKRR